MMKALLCQYQGKVAVLITVNILSIGTDKPEQMLQAKTSEPSCLKHGYLNKLV